MELTLNAELSESSSIQASIEEVTMITGDMSEVQTITESDHARLEHLSYETSGHTGFQAALTAGQGIDITNNVISNTGVTNIAVNASGSMVIWQGLPTV